MIKINYVFFRSSNIGGFIELRKLSEMLKLELHEWERMNAHSAINYENEDYVV